MAEDKKKTGSSPKSGATKSSNASKNTTKKESTKNPFVTPVKDEFNKEQRDKQLQRLDEQLSKNSGNDGRAWDIIKRLLIILLIAILLAGIGIAVYFLAKNTGAVTGGGVIKLSMNVSENLSDESGDQSISEKLIYPGNKFAVKCVIRNSDNIQGDQVDNINQYNRIFVRFSIALQVGNDMYNNMIIPLMTELQKDNFHFYDPLEEQSDYVWDGFYYFYGALNGNQSLTLFEEIQFDFHNIPNSFGAQDAKIIVTVDAVQADVNNLGEEGGDAWNTAPRKWIQNMKKGINQEGGTIII